MTDQAASCNGYVYVATNPAMPGLAKIGHTAQNDPQSRITALFTTNVPLPFVLEYAAAVTDPRQVEQALHVAFAPQRLHPKREFFEVDPGQVIAILNLVEVADITDEEKTAAEGAAAPEDREALDRATKRRPIFRFSDLGLPPGSVLTFKWNEQVQAKIVDERKVKLVALPDGEYPQADIDGEPLFLGPLSAKLMGWASVAPLPYWIADDGQLLIDIYNEKYGPR